MEFKLASTLYNELDANQLKAKLEGAGLQVKLSAVKTAPTRYQSLPDTFGLYVEEDKLDQAKQIAGEFKPIGSPAVKVPKPVKIYSIVFLLAIVVGLAYAIFEMIKYFSGK